MWANTYPLEMRFVARVSRKGISWTEKERLSFPDSRDLFSASTRATGSESGNHRDIRFVAGAIWKTERERDVFLSVGFEFGSSRFTFYDLVDLVDLGA